MQEYLRLRPAALALVAALALGGCQSSEEKAEEYYRSGMALLEAGDVDRALVEFRNVFQYNGFHKDARRTYADTILARGEVSEAYGQYLRLIEQYPDTPDVRRILAEIAVSRGDWREAERHGREAIRLAPDAPGVATIGLALDYRDAVLGRDDPARAELAEQARAILKATPEDRIARRLLIGHLIEAEDAAGALPEIEAALALEPDLLDLHVMKVKMLAKLDDSPAVGTQLQEMAKRFPDNIEVRSALIQWYLSERDFAGAEAFLRGLAGPDDGPAAGHMAVVQLLQAVQGPEAARAELARLIEANRGGTNADLYRALLAGLDFEAGHADKAVAEMEAILKTAAASDQTRTIKVMLAQMLDRQDNRVGARARVEEVLAEDARHVEALKLRARWLIDEDRPAEAIIDLRAALDQAPRDASVLTLMAEAHERDGSTDLAGERLAMAVDVSGKAAEESLRYAQFLLRQGRDPAARQVLVESRQANPAHVGVLSLLADLALKEQDWAAAREIADTLRKIGSDAAAQAATAVQAGLLLGQDKSEEGVALLEDMASGSGELKDIALVVQTHLDAGHPDEAHAYLDAELAARPDDPGLRLLKATLSALQGDTPAAEEMLRALVAEEPGAEQPARLLYGLLRAAGRGDEALAVLDAAIEAAPESPGLLWMKAGVLEQAGDIAGAISIYESLYATDSSNVIVANNLASLLTAHDGDPASLDRAAAIARRLRGSDVPAFQDTYGWIEYRRGNLSEALAHLEPAAEGLPNDPLVQFHLGMTYAALDRRDDARKALARALEIAGDSPLPQFETARETLAALPAPGN